METVHALRKLADKLNNMWGRSPDADLIRKAAMELEEVHTPTEESVEAPKRGRKGSTNE